MIDRSSIVEGIDTQLTRNRLWIAIAGLSGTAAVIADTLAAHVAKNGPASSNLATGARYGLLHAVALIGVTLIAATSGAQGVLASRSLAITGWCFAGGLLLFPGSLYLLGAGAGAAWASLAPVGGTLLILGWLALLVFALAPRPAR
jgi:uncharacterized membrane protein YgdD (TMEM256/DUF423 family)